MDVQEIRQQFPILHQQVHGRPLVYLDNAATTQKPQSVIDVLRHYYEHDNANVHRGVHSLSERATAAYEAARDTARDFIHAASSRELIFVRGATEAINLVAHSYGQLAIQAGDEVLITEMEHHSNIVPWQLLCERVGAHLRVAPILDDGSLDLSAWQALLTERTRLVAIVHQSNALGSINPVAEMIEQAHGFGAKVLLDGAQACAHLSIDVQALDVDFYVSSAHKSYGPTGIGFLYAKAALLEAMPPYQSGGDMIKVVSFDQTIYNDLPYRFEAGTPNIAGAIGMAAGMDFIRSIGIETIAKHEQALLQHASQKAAAFAGLRQIGTAKDKASVLSFVMDGVHAHDLGTILDRAGIAIRAGHHCAMPVMQRYGLAATARASFAVYNTLEEIDVLFEGLEQAQALFA